MTGFRQALLVAAALALLTTGCSDENVAETGRSGASEAESPDTTATSAVPVTASDFSSAELAAIAEVELGDHWISRQETSIGDALTERCDWAEFATALIATGEFTDELSELAIAVQSATPEQVAAFSLRVAGGGLVACADRAFPAEPGFIWVPVRLAPLGDVRGTAALVADTVVVDRHNIRQQAVTVLDVFLVESNWVAALWFQGNPRSTPERFFVKVASALRGD